MTKVDQIFPNQGKISDSYGTCATATRYSTL
jgi:hypothetical protein